MMSRIKNLAGWAGASACLTLAGCGGSQATDMSGYNTQQQNTTNMVSSATSLSAATLGSKLLPIEGKQTFITGVNVSSFAGQPDVQLGKNPLQPNVDVAYNAKSVVAGLQDISGFGCNAVRIVLFDKMDGLKLDSNGVVSGLDETFMKNLSDLLAKAESSKVQVYVCLAGPWSTWSSVKNPITDISARTAYLKNAITPLAGKLRGRPNVLAIDIQDEIEADIAGKDGNNTDKGATWDQARAFIKATADIIKSVDSARLITCSSGLHSSQNVKSGKFSKLSLDFYDYHVYDDKGNLPAAKDLRLDRPVLIGECGQKSTKADNDVQAKADVAFLTNAFQQGYAGALISDYGKDPLNVQSLLDKDGKHRPVITQVQTFLTNLPMMSASATALGK